MGGITAPDRHQRHDGAGETRRAATECRQKPVSRLVSAGFSFSCQYLKSLPDIQTLQAQLNALFANLSKAKLVRFQGRETEQQSIADIERAIGIVQTALAQAQNGNGPRRVAIYQYDNL